MKDIVVKIDHPTARATNCHQIWVGGTYLAFSYTTIIAFSGTVDGRYQRIRHPDNFSRTTGRHYRETGTYDWPKAESDEDFQKKLQHALRAGIHPMLAAIDTLHGEGESNEH